MYLFAETKRQKLAREHDRSMLILSLIFFVSLPAAPVPAPLLPVRMVAPVRETAAQLLAVAALQLDANRLRQAGELLLELTTAEEWQARHGGYCGLESLCAVAVRGDDNGGGGGGRGGGSRQSCDRGSGRYFRLT